MAEKTECYVDTSGFIAFLDSSDTWHPLFRQLFSQPPLLSTSALVIAEGHGWFLRRYDQQRAVRFLAFVDVLPRLTIVPFTGGELTLATEGIRKFSDQPLTIADAHGLLTMKQRHVTACWSTDRHLGLTGVPLAVHRGASTH